MLLEANRVCNSEIELDHPCKVKVKTALAVLYHKIARGQGTEGDNREELLSKIEECMKEGLDMWYRLNDGKKSIRRLGNRKEIVKVLDMYPERFKREYSDEPL